MDRGASSNSTRNGGYLTMKAEPPEMSIKETELSRRGEEQTQSDTSDVSSADGECANETYSEMALQLLIDLAASVAFWYVMLYVDFPGNSGWIVFGSVIGSMVAWRLYRAFGPQGERPSDIPYTCGYMSSNGKEIFLVATLHISPRAPRDVHSVIDVTNPHVAMIELDEERLDRMRDPEEVRVQEIPEPDKEDLQEIRITTGGNWKTIYAQRAQWNGEMSGQDIEGEIVFDTNNAYALTNMNDSVNGSIALVHRGSPAGEFAPFALKAHHAAKGNAEAVFVINSDKEGPKLPTNPIGTGSGVFGELRVAASTCNCGFPAVPVFLLSHDDGAMLLDSCQQGALPQASLTVRSDNYPRRTLRRRLCQACALMFSGIGILYGIIGLFNVEVGAEFVAAEEAAIRHKIPCLCIDVNLNQFWYRLGMAVVPSPCNLGKSLLAWLAFPRVFFRVLFPARDGVDVLGSTLLHLMSLSLTTWVAFILAGFCASLVTNSLLRLIGYGGEKAAAGAGVVDESDQEFVEDVQNYIMLAVELYMLPRIYQSVAASRDETMYKNIISKSRDLERQGKPASKMVVVVGAAHSNGILQRIRARGL